eukprot:2531316-Rhodomonas_salina.1
MHVVRRTLKGTRDSWVFCMYPGYDHTRPRVLEMGQSAYLPGVPGDETVTVWHVARAAKE